MTPTLHTRHFGGRFVSEAAGGLGALGGGMLMQDLISGLGVRGPAAAALTQFGSGVAANDDRRSMVCAA